MLKERGSVWPQVELGWGGVGKYDYMDTWLTRLFKTSEHSRENELFWGKQDILIIHVW